MKYIKPFNLFQDLMKAKPLERGRLLGLDVGDKYVGLAVSDAENKIASPLRPQEEVEHIGLLDVQVDVKLPTGLCRTYIWVYNRAHYPCFWLFLGRSVRKGTNPWDSRHCGFCGNVDVSNLTVARSVLLRKKTNIDLMATDLQNLVSELSLKGFIIGYPFDRSRNSPDAVQVKLFIDDLCKTGSLEGLRYTFWDECFTSKNVELLLKPLNLHPVLYKTMVDKFAAVGILQGYLDYVNRTLVSNRQGCSNIKKCGVVIHK